MIGNYIYLFDIIIIISLLIIHQLKPAYILNTPTSYFSLQPQPSEVGWAEKTIKMVFMAKGHLECKVSWFLGPKIDVWIRKIFMDKNKPSQGTLMEQ